MLCPAPESPAQGGRTGDRPTPVSLSGCAEDKSDPIGAGSRRLPVGRSLDGPERLGHISLVPADPPGGALPCAGSVAQRRSKAGRTRVVRRSEASHWGRPL